MKFLETITALGNDALIPIDRIKYINYCDEGGLVIKIFTDDGDFMECFGENFEKAEKRYTQIKNIVGAK